MIIILRLLFEVHSERSMSSIAQAHERSLFLFSPHALQRGEMSNRLRSCVSAVLSKLAVAAPCGTSAADEMLPHLGSPACCAQSLLFLRTLLHCFCAVVHLHSCSPGANPCRGRSAVALPSCKRNLYTLPTKECTEARSAQSPCRSDDKVAAAKVIYVSIGFFARYDSVPVLAGHHPCQGQHRAAP